MNHVRLVAEFLSPLGEEPAPAYPPHPARSNPHGHPRHGNPRASSDGAHRSGLADPTLGHEHGLLHTSPGLQGALSAAESELPDPGPLRSERAGACAACMCVCFVQVCVCVGRTVRTQSV